MESSPTRIKYNSDSSRCCVWCVCVCVCLYHQVQLQLQVHHEKYFCTEYEKSKVAADKIAVQAASEGVPIVLLYPGVIYGPGKVTAGNVLARMVINVMLSMVYGNLLYDI